MLWVCVFHSRGGVFRANILYRENLRITTVFDEFLHVGGGESGYAVHMNLGNILYTFDLRCWRNIVRIEVSDFGEARGTVQVIDRRIDAMLTAPILCTGTRWHVPELNALPSRRT